MSLDQIDDMLRTLAHSRESIEEQIQTLTECEEKQNAVLLKVESIDATNASGGNTSASNSEIKCKLSKQSVQTITQLMPTIRQIIELREQTSSIEMNDLEEYLEKSKARNDNLLSFLRKLLALNESVAQMKGFFIKENADETSIIDELSEDMEDE